MELESLILLLISCSLLSISAKAICVPRNSAHGAPSTLSNSTSSSPAQHQPQSAPPTSSSPKSPPPPTSSRSPSPKPSTSSPPKSPPPATSSPQPSTKPSPSSPSPDPKQSPSSNPPFSIQKGDGINELTSLPRILPTNNNPVLQKICSSTDYPEVCLSSTTPLLTGVVDPVTVLKIQMQALRKSFENAMAAATKMMKDPSSSASIKSGLDTCIDTYDDGLYDLDDALTAISSRDIGRLNSLLSAVISYVSTCEDSFAEEPGVYSPMKGVDGHLEKLASNNLAIAALLHWN